MNAAPERVAALDVLRGLAILLILLMNIPAMGSYLQTAFDQPFLAGWEPIDRAAWYASRVLLAGTQRGLLELLFGAGAAILLARLGDEGVGAFGRRYLLLAAFGLAHALVLGWPGDILLSYGLAALALPLFRDWPARRLLALGFGYALLMTAVGAAQYADRAGVQAAVERVVVAQATERAPSQADLSDAATWREARAALTLDQATLAEERAARMGSVAEHWRHQVAAWRRINLDGLGIFLNLVEPFFTMLLGLALLRIGVLTGERRARSYLLAGAVGYGVGLPLRWLEATEVATLTLAPRVGWISAEPARLLVTAGHLAAVLLLLRTTAGARLLRPFAAVGRMALSLYLLQSALCLWLIFPRWGLGLWGELSYAGLIGLALGLVALQLLLARWWTRRFALGPAEWAWRSLAERRRLPLRAGLAGQAARLG